MSPRHFQPSSQVLQRGLVTKTQPFLESIFPSPARYIIPRLPSASWNLSRTELHHIIHINPSIMAVNLASAPTSFHQAPSPTTYHRFTSNTTDHSRRPTPTSSATATPSATSPTSPRTASSSPTQTHSAFYSRQLRPPKAPLYVPAVLRPTEKPSRFAHGSKHSSITSVSKVGSPNGPLTPPSTPGTSFDSADGTHLTDENMQRHMLGDEGYKVGVTRVVTDEWNEELLEEVTGIPTRNHWKVCDFYLFVWFHRCFDFRSWVCLFLFEECCSIEAK